MCKEVLLIPCPSTQQPSTIVVREHMFYVNLPLSKLLFPSSAWRAKECSDFSSLEAVKKGAEEKIGAMLLSVLRQS